MEKTLINDKDEFYSWLRFSSRGLQVMHGDIPDQFPCVVVFYTHPHSNMRDELCYKFVYQTDFMTEYDASHWKEKDFEATSIK